ncbi:MAG: M48 family metalloprotease [Rhodoferax sp.]
MKQADFMHMVRLNELACAENADAYRRKVMVFAALGYAWVLGCLVLALALLAWALPPLLHGRLRAWNVALLIAALGLGWASLRALWMRFGTSEGIRIEPGEAPALFEALEHIRRKVKGPVLDAVYVDQDFNASIRQQPRWGLFGGTRNTLTIGLPFAMALDRQRLLAVLAHEYGHLRGGHGRFSAWVYRTRVAWMRLHDHLSEDTGLAGMATRAFLNWYFPRFVAQTFAMARQDEYEADRISARLLGAPTTSAALVEIAVKDAWMQQFFWAQHWRSAAGHPTPVGPYQTMAQPLGLAPETPFAYTAFRQALARPSDASDTHPGLRDRMEALEQALTLPPWSRGNALALMGPKVGTWIAQFDREWCRDNASAWKQHHAYLGRVRERVEQLARTRGSNNANELVEEAQLRRQLDAREDVLPLYELALQRSSEHPRALRGWAQALAEAAPDARLPVLERLWAASPDQRWWAASTAVEALETPRRGAELDMAALQRWRERAKQAEEAEQRAWEELTEPPWFQHTRGHDLGAFELAELQADLARCTSLHQAWLLCKQLREFPQRRAYLLVVELPGLADEERFALCRQLERQLGLPGPVLALWVGDDPSPAEIRRLGHAPVFSRAG